MAMELLCGTHDALYDVKMSKRKCKQLDNEWDKYKRLVEEKNTDCSYQQFLSFILDSTKMHKHNKRERGNVIYIDEEDESDGKNDPQYELFLSRLKKHKKSYAVEGENNGVPFLINYEEESGLEDEWDRESRRKMMTCAEQIVEPSNQKTRLPLNNHAAAVKHRSDMQAQSDNNSSTRCARASMNLVKGQNVRGRKSAPSTQKPNFRTKGLMQNQHACDMQALCSRKSNVRNCKPLKSNRETLVRACDRLLPQKPGPRINWLTKNECDYDHQAQLVERDKVQSRTKSGKVAKGDHGADAEALIQIDKGHFYQLPGRRNNWVTVNKVPNLRGKFKVVEGMNLVKEENEPDKIEVIKIDEAHFYQKPGPRDNWVKENLYGHANQAQPGDKEKVVSQVYLQQLCKGNNVIGEDGGAHRKSVVRIDNEYLHQKPNQKNNRLAQYQNEHVDQARPVKKYKEHTDRKFKGKNIVKVEHEANKKSMVQIENENFYRDPGRRNNRVSRNYCELVNQVQQGKKDVVHGLRELMKVGQGDRGLSNQETAFKNYAVKNEPDDVQTRVHTGLAHNNIRSVKTAKCTMIYKNSNKNNLIKEGNDEIVPELEILDSAAFIKKGMLSPFVSSKRFHKSMMADDFCDPDWPSASDKFREEVLEVLRKPYDKEECKRHREAIRVGSYLHHHPDVGKKLKKYRYKQAKCLTILRGFFFWLQNLTREGAFQPWKDRQCLAVEPPSP